MGQISLGKSVSCPTSFMSNQPHKDFAFAGGPAFPNPLPGTEGGGSLEPDQHQGIKTLHVSHLLVVGPFMALPRRILAF